MDACLEWGSQVPRRLPRPTEKRFICGRGTQTAPFQSIKGNVEILIVRLPLPGLFSAAN